MLPPDTGPRGRSDGIGVTGPPARRSSLRVLRWIPLALALGALGAFGGIVIYAYYLVDRGAADAGVPLIRAETTPIKVRPESPGGTQVPHQDKEIFGRISPRAEQGQAEPPRVERLLPPPETPLPRPPAAPPILSPSMPPPPDLEPPPEAVVVTLPPPSTPPAAPAWPASESPAPGANSSAANPGRPPVTPNAQAPAPTPAPVVSLPPPAGPAAQAGGFRVQIGALRSAELANAEWARLRRAHADLLGPLAPTVQRFDRGSEAEALYRLQAGPLADAGAAAALCEQLKGRRLTCLVVRP